MHILSHLIHTISMKKNFILCGLAGWCMEVLWTGLGSIVSRDPKLICRTSMWMFPIYGMAAFFKPISSRLMDKSALLRGCLYAFLIFITEYTSGSILKKFQRCPWDYSGQPANVHGLINLCYAPLWFGAGLFFEHFLTVIPGEK